MYSSERLPPKLCIDQSTYCDLELQILKASPVNPEILQWKHPKLSPSWSRRLSSCFKHIYQIATFRSLGPLYDKKPFYPKKLSPRLKLTGTAHWDWIHHKSGTFLILISSPLMIERCLLQEAIALFNNPQRLPQVGDILSSPEVCLCKPQEAFY